MAGTKMTLRRSTRVTQSKTKKMQEILSPELFIRRESDGSGGEMSESEESVDSCEEEMFAQGEDFLLHNQPSEDSDVDWEPEVSGPASKRQRRDDGSSSDEERRGGDVGASSSPEEEKWNDVDEPDITPAQPTFRPTYSPGPQLVHTASYTPLQIFQMFFSNSVLQTIARNTNAFGSTHHSTPSAPWVDVTVPDLLSYMSLVVFMGVVKCSAFTDYWRGGKLYNLQFPRLAMSGKKFLRICRPLHLSNPADDADNEQRRGTASFDRLAKIKPLYEEMREACKRNYHPYQEISIDERTVASKARVGLKRYMKGKPVRNGYKLFVLADSRNGYTWDFFVDQKKAQGTSGKGLSYDSVMALVDTRILGTGYKLYVDDFYTSPALFRDLLQKKIWACGTVRANRSGFPKTRVNGMGSKSPHGSIRWIREDSLLFVQWRDTRDVSLCSTVHTAHSDERVQRRSKGADGVWEVKDVSIPPAVKDYNRYELQIQLWIQSVPLHGKFNSSLIQN
ncbi:piggyBac transposable element-derived protein 4-like [Cololabis saira]|uniref:piggyBac transposable element-derived protein 4-like n=1 Tax=Cololabis saira TaxID=129043 RepID=UPI002AD3E521|nr:piggyBac transposable element-derived protein 4-like [Cololabis saira]